VSCEFSEIQIPENLLNGGEDAEGASGTDLKSPATAPQVLSELRKEFAPEVGSGEKRRRIERSC
jgi:hypothetical protein